MMQLKCIVNNIESPETKIYAARERRSHHPISKNKNRCTQRASQTASNIQNPKSMQPESAADSIKSQKSKIDAAIKHHRQHRNSKIQNRCSQKTPQTASNLQYPKSMHPERATDSIESPKTKIDAPRKHLRQQQISSSQNSR
ncbi:hypothetical protein FZC84_05150 [Rossellomorea vietnamensis]|uniref:Uncharacterized protein n=1 Tax=Rossellomorea vietnamensis TaxID=218284 RepID=A0A5D4MG65_9BACI|nr:hypothetical protein FZC84_05150 [Rossellomorea vietnamensis]